jgi:hydrogenase maturation protein HypF
VQHHHAHAAALLAEHGVSEPALVVVCDGVGYGADGGVWGGELLEVRPLPGGCGPGALPVLDQNQGYSRLGHLRPMLLPGGDAAALDTRRSAAGLLWMATHGADQKNPSEDCEAFHQRMGSLFPDPSERDMLLQMLQSGAGCVASSAAGRVFDGMAALLSVCTRNEFEAQAPMALEAAAGGIVPRPQLRAKEMVTRGPAGLTIDLTPLVRQLADAVGRGESKGQLAADFHEAFAQVWAAAVAEAARRTGRRIVGLSGGVFCNALLTRRLSELLAAQGLTVLRHQRVPANDGGIPFGQAAVAMGRLTRPDALSGGMNDREFRI